MKKLALLLFFCAVGFAPLANAGDCDHTFSCDSGCGPCHFTAQFCGNMAPPYNCNDCGSPPCMYLKAIPQEHRVTSVHKPGMPGHMSLTDVGMAFLAATMPSLFHSRTSGLPPGHPVVTRDQLEKVQNGFARQNKVPQGCRAPVAVQILTASMLRK